MIRRAGEAGMTLIEMLIVLAIIAVSAGAVTLGIGSATRAPSVEAEARGLATRLQAAADDAMLGDRMVAFTAERSGYGFTAYGENGPVPLAEGALAFHKLPGGMILSLDAKPPVLLGDGNGKPMTATIASGGQRWRVFYDGMTATAAKAPPA
jgi:general secretion pathway protein H